MCLCLSIVFLICMGISPTAAIAQSNLGMTYDDLGRLTQVTYPGGVIIQYSYDAAGNRTTYSVTGSPNAPPSTGGGGGGSVPIAASINDPLFNQNLTTANTEIYYGGQVFGGWKVSAGTTGIWRSGGGPGQAPKIDGSQIVSLNLWDVYFGDVEQTLTTQVGATYTLNFKMAGEDCLGTKSLRVSAGSTFADYNWTAAAGCDVHVDRKPQAKTFTFVASATTTLLKFHSLMPTGKGPVIAAMSVSATAPGGGAGPPLPVGQPQISVSPASGTTEN
jgi:YD repeat-containing protein